jgi:hypothetical protein
MPKALRRLRMRWPSGLVAERAVGEWGFCAFMMAANLYKFTLLHLQTSENLQNISRPINGLLLCFAKHVTLNMKFNGSSLILECLCSAR